MRMKIVALLGMLMMSGAVQAEGVLAVAPLRLMLSDKTNNDVLTLTNRSEKTQTYKLVMEDQAMQANGSIIRQDDFAYSAKRMLRFMPRQVTLAPNQRQNIRVMATLPEGLADGDYHTHLIFEQQKPQETEGAQPDKGLKIKMENIYSVGVPVIVRKGKMESDLRLDSASREMKGEKTVVNVSLTRTGNSEASGVVKVVDAASGEVLGTPRTTHVYREADKVTLQMPVKTDGKPMQVLLEKEGREPEKVDVK